MAILTSLLECLTRLTTHELRAIATRLGLEPKRDERHPQLRDRIADAWQQSDWVHQWVRQLSPEACSALQYLIHAQEVPAALFWADYGTVRPARRQGQPHSPPPWRMPATASEELFYAGVLHSVDGRRLDRCTALCVPLTLRSTLFAALPQLPTPLPASQVPGWSQLQRIGLNMGQLLIFCHECQVLGKSVSLTSPLSKSTRSALWPRLLTPALADLALLRHEEQWLLHLAIAGKWLHEGGVTPAGWAWLALPPSAQWQGLWHAWLAADGSVRARTYQPDAQLSPPWPGLLVTALSALRAPFSVMELTARLLQPALHGYWTAHFASLSSLEDLLAELLAGPLSTMGVVVRQSTELEAPWYALSEAGRWLLGLSDASSVPTVPCTSTQVVSLTEAAIIVRSPSDASATALAALAPFASDGQLLAEVGGEPAAVSYQWSLRPASVARAAAAGVGLAQLWSALAQLRVVLPTPRVQQIDDWYQRGSQLELVMLPLLRTRTAGQLAALCQDPQTQELISEVLGETAAVLRVEPVHALAILQQAGHFARTPQMKLGSAPAPAPAALWLAGQLYAWLGHHLALPLPPPYSELDRLWRHFAGEEQAALQAQWEALRAALPELLEGRSFAPCPTPSTPEQWLPILNHALAQQSEPPAPAPSLILEYWTAARGLLTVRTIQPMWLEKHDDTLYLRAFCQLAQRVLLFRLDRIQRIIEPTEVDEL